VALAAISTETL